MRTAEYLERIAAAATLQIKEQFRVFGVGREAPEITPAIALCVIMAMDQDDEGLSVAPVQKNGPQAHSAAPSPAPHEERKQSDPKPRRPKKKRQANQPQEEWWPEVQEGLQRLSVDGFCPGSKQWNADKPDGAPSVATILRRLGTNSWGNLAQKAGLEPLGRGKRAPRPVPSVEELEKREARFRHAANGRDGDA